jgi:hypothetical protein
MRFDRTQYQRGADFERKVRDHCMHELGATYVVRSAGSRGMVDLVVFFIGEDVNAVSTIEPISIGSDTIMSQLGSSFVSPVVWLVQCKRDGKLKAEDRELLTSLATETGCAPYLAFVGPNGVELEEISANPNAEATDIRRG